MSRGLRWRVGWVGAAVLIFGYLALANFVPQATREKSGLIPDRGVRLGLDLRGGIHWVVGVRLEEALTHELNYLRGNLGRELDDDDVEVGESRVKAGRLVVDVRGTLARNKVRQFADDTTVLVEVDSNDDEIAFEITKDWQQEVRERAMQQVLEVLRRRIDDPATGVPESVVTRQGRDRVLVQIPGGDRESARRLLTTTGFLEFKMVLDQAASEDLLLARSDGSVPEGKEVVFEEDKETRRKLVAYLVNETADLTGDYLADARVGFDRQQRPIVNFTFTPEGGERFQKLTSENIGNQLAIILEEKVYSAPTIQSRISMRGQITGRFTSQEAAELAVVLRAGALSVPTVIEEERTVGPALGADSIRSGTRASAVGLVAVILFTVAYYRRSGVFASVALVANLLLLIGLMSLPDIGATLTLPGIAGLVLTVGMAIDANVIIFERIREELRAGKLPRAAVETGFNKARWTILDANITTLITALVLYQFGTGPIKGFAVTLSIGIITSVFAALVITRLLFELAMRGEHRLDKLSI